MGGVIAAAAETVQTLLLERGQFWRGLRHGWLTLLVDRKPFPPRGQPFPIEVGWALVWATREKPREGHAEVCWRFPDEPWTRTSRWVTPEQPVAWLAGGIGIDFRRLLPAAAREVTVLEASGWCPTAEGRMGGVTVSQTIYSTYLDARQFYESLTAGDVGVLVGGKPLAPERTRESYRGPCAEWKLPVEIGWVLVWAERENSDDASAEICWRYPGKPWVKTRRRICPRRPVARLTKEIGVEFCTFFGKRSSAHRAFARRESMGGAAAGETVSTLHLGQGDFLEWLRVGWATVLEVREPLVREVFRQLPIEVGWVLLWAPRERSDEGHAEVCWRFPGEPWVRTSRWIRPNQPRAWLTQDIGIDFHRFFRRGRAQGLRA
jgi:hypothetical protein